MQAAYTTISFHCMSVLMYVERTKRRAMNLSNMNRKNGMCLGNECNIRMQSNIKLKIHSLFVHMIQWLGITFILFWNKFKLCFIEIALFLNLNKLSKRSYLHINLANKNSIETAHSLNQGSVGIPRHWTWTLNTTYSSCNFDSIRRGTFNSNTHSNNMLSTYQYTHSNIRSHTKKTKWSPNSNRPNNLKSKRIRILSFISKYIDTSCLAKLNLVKCFVYLRNRKIPRAVFTSIGGQTEIVSICISYRNNEWNEKQKLETFKIKIRA